MTRLVMDLPWDAPAHPEQRDEAGHQLAVLLGADGGVGGRALIPRSRLRTHAPRSGAACASHAQAMTAEQPQARMPLANTIDIV